MKVMDRDELKGRLASAPGRTVLVDVRERGEYEAEHIKGAISIPLTELCMRAAREFKKDEEIIVYCGNPDCRLSEKAARVLEKKGYTNVHDYEGGLSDWKSAHYRTEGIKQAA